MQLRQRPTEEVSAAFKAEAERKIAEHENEKLHMQGQLAQYQETVLKQADII